MLVSVADVARLQVAPRKFPNSGESGYSEVRSPFWRRLQDLR